MKFFITSSEICHMKKLLLNSAKLFSLCFVLAVFNNTPINAQNYGATFMAGPTTQAAKIYPVSTLLPNGKVIGFGGRGYNFISSSTAELYNPSGNSFTQKNMHTPHDHMAVVKLSDGRYFIMGGSTDLGVPAYSDCEMYNPVTDSFYVSSDMYYPRMMNSATQLKNGNVLVAGAWYNTTAASFAEVFDTATLNFTLTGSLVTPRSFPIVLPTDDGNAILTGGFPVFGGNIHTTVEAYNAGTKTFSQISTQVIPTDSGWIPSTPYTRPIADCKLNNGKYVLMASRDIGNGAEYGLLLFDPVAKTFSKFATSSPLRDSLNDGGLIDIIINHNDNLVYLLGVDSGYDPIRYSLVTVNMSSGLTIHPNAAFQMPTSEYFYPSVTYIPTVKKILVQGINSTNSSYFTGTNKTYLLTPSFNVGMENPVQQKVQLSCYPNPANHFLNVEFEAGIAADYTISITDMLGREMQRESRHEIAGIIQWTINTSNLSKGMYVISVKSIHGASSKSIIINN